MTAPDRTGPLDWAAVAGLLLLTAVYVTRAVDFGRHPEEDAAMLLRYSEHLATGHGIVWNVGEAPLDGATDFLFMLVVAGVTRAGVAVERAAQGVALVAHALCVVLLYLAARRLLGAGPLLAVLPAAYLAVGTGPRYAAAGYGTPLFALVACVAWVTALRLAQAERESAGLARALGLLGVLLGMARPEGALFALLLFGALAASCPRQRAMLLREGLGVFAVAGAAYFAWRWTYFGQPLPNPFYRKSGGELHWDAMRRAFRDVARLAGPFLILALAGLFERRQRRVALLALAPVAGFALLWALVYDETNYFMRFRYPMLPVVLLASMPVAVVVESRARLSASRLRVGAALAGSGVLVAALVAWQHARFQHIVPRRSGLFDVAMTLRPYASRGYTLATTEAGLLPLYSGWRAVDAWGLNDRWIARHGELTPAYLDRYQPELILIHAYFSPGLPEAGPEVDGRGLGPRWAAMARGLKGYAERRGYRLAAVFGRSPTDTHYYYVKRDCPDADAITARIRSLDYFWDGQRVDDLAP